MEAEEYEMRTEAHVSDEDEQSSLIDLFLVNCENCSELKITDFCFMHYNLFILFELQLWPE